MWNWTVQSPSAGVATGAAKSGLDWTKLDQHLREVGAFHTTIYRTLRDLTPALILSMYWLARHPGVLFRGPAWWYTPRISLLEFVMLAAVTLLSRAVTRRGWSSREEHIHREMAASLAAAFLCSAVLYPCLLSRLSWRHALAIDAGFFLGSSLLSLLLLAAACLAAWASIDTLVPKREVLIVGSGRGAQAVFEEMADSPVYQVVGILDDEFVGNGPMRERYLGRLDSLDALLKRHPVSIVFCSLPVKSMYEPIQRVIEVCERFGVEVRHSSHLFQTSIARLDPRSQANHSILRMVRRDSTRYVKRAIDLAGAALLLVVTAPLVLAAGIAIRITSPGPVFFSQDRYGLHRRRFRILKLRTMVVDAEKLQAQLEASNELDGPAFKIRRDPRITKVGGFLRKTSLDELPQLWNVLKGEMSLVGPRPLAVRDVLMIEDSAQLRRFSVLPGITCIWQISGRNNTDFGNWIRQDLEYIDSWSLLLDLKILLGTIPAVLWGRGAM